MSEKIAASAERDNGGQAFPQPITVGPSGDAYPAYPGMSLRDWFAGQALAGIIAGSCRAVSLEGTEGLASDRALAAYIVADAMLAERSK